MPSSIAGHCLSCSLISSRHPVRAPTCVFFGWSMWLCCPPRLFEDLGCPWPKGLFQGWWLSEEHGLCRGAAAPSGQSSPGAIHHPSVPPELFLLPSRTGTGTQCCWSWSPPERLQLGAAWQGWVAAPMHSFVLWCVSRAHSTCLFLFYLFYKPGLRFD